MDDEIDEVIPSPINVPSPRGGCIQYLVTVQWDAVLFEASKPRCNGIDFTGEGKYYAKRDIRKHDYFDWEESSKAEEVIEYLKTAKIIVEVLEHV